MKGKRVLANSSGTGVSSGIALEFAQKGADIVVHFAHNATWTRRVVEQIWGLGQNREIFKAACNIIDDAVRLEDQGMTCLGRVDRCEIQFGLCA